MFLYLFLLKFRLNQDMKTHQPTFSKEDYENIYSLYFPKLVRFSQSFVLSRQDAENLVQDLFLYLWEHLNLFEPIGNINAFLFTLIKNRCIDFLRKQTISAKQKHSISNLYEKELELKLYSLQKFDENNFINSEIESIITNAINSLPERCREIFIMSRMDGLKHKDIAERLHISTNTIEGQISIALKKLRIVLKDYSLLYFFII